MKLAGKGDGGSKLPPVAAAATTTPPNDNVSSSITDIPNKELIIITQSTLKLSP